MALFEQTKQTVGTHSVLMTSWFDEGKGTWRASAPAYSHLHIVLDTVQVACDTRPDALALLCKVLAPYLAARSG